MKFIRRWLCNLPIDDPVARPQAMLLQLLLLGIIGMFLLASAISLAYFLTVLRTDVDWIINVASVLLFATPLFVLRRGNLWGAAMLLTGLLLLFTLIWAPTANLETLGAVSLIHALAFALVALLLGRRWLIAVFVVSVVITAFGAVRSVLPSSEIGADVIVLNFALLGGVLCLFLDGFRASLQGALVAARSREQDLMGLQLALEERVDERTAALQEALQAVEQREVRLVQTLSALEASQATIRVLSAPVLPVLPGVLVAPLIGTIDSDRAIALTNNVLRSIELTHARHVIFDITGVAVVDIEVARVVLAAAAAARLLGTKAWLVGIRPEVAQTIVTLQIDTSRIETYSSLQEAVTAILNRPAKPGL